MGEVRHLRGAGVGVEEVEEVGVVGWEAVAEMDGFHRIEEGVGGVMVVEVAWPSLGENVRIQELSSRG